MIQYSEEYKAYVIELTMLLSFGMMSRMAAVLRSLRMSEIHTCGISIELQKLSMMR